VVFDLRQNPEELYALDNEEIKLRLYSTAAELQKDHKFRPALKTIHINKCPMISPAAVIKSISKERLIQWELDITAITRHLTWIRSNPAFTSKIYDLFSAENIFPNETDPDLMIYSGFFGPMDKKLMAEVRAATELELADKEFPFVDQRLPEMLFRYKARNYPSSLNDEEQEKWESYRISKLLNRDSQYMTFNAYFERIQEVANNIDVTGRDYNILEDLKYYAESIIPYSYD
jgi:exodeoxyribonuclease-1